MINYSFCCLFMYRMVVLSAFEHIYDNNYRYTLGDLFYETTRNFINLDTQSYSKDYQEEIIN